MKTILLVAGLNERYYYDPFLDACKTKDLKIYVCDPLRFPNEANMSISLDKHGDLSGYIDVLEFDGEDYVDTRLPISDIDIAWYLRESSMRSREDKRSLEDRFIENETRVALRSFLSTLQCTWVNRKADVDMLVSNKLLQQVIAQKCGLTVPWTVISNDPDVVLNFSDLNNGLLLKSLGYIRLDEEGKYALYSEHFSHEELVKNRTGIQTCPVFVQEYVPKRYEHRVMVIGDRVLSCRIDSQASEKTRIDWRHYDFEHVEHVQVELPYSVQQSLLLFMNQVGLHYGALDLIESPEGDFVFLEVNPSGQWGWIADLAGLPIPDVVAEMLCSL